MQGKTEILIILPFLTLNVPLKKSIETTSSGKMK